MSFTLTWMGNDGVEGTQTFPTEQEAREAARAVEGVAVLNRDPVGSATVFRDGQELDGADASDALARFGHKIEVGVSRPGEPETNLDPDDTTGSGWRAGTPAVYGWRLWKGRDRLTEWVGTYSTPEAAIAAAEEAREKDPELAGLSIVRIDR